MKIEIEITEGEIREALQRAARKIIADMPLSVGSRRSLIECSRVHLPEVVREVVEDRISKMDFDAEIDAAVRRNLTRLAKKASGEQ